MRDTRAPDASPYVDEITLSPHESGIYDAFDRLRQAKQDRDWDVLISLTDLTLRRDRPAGLAEVCGDVVVLSVLCWEHSAAALGNRKGSRRSSPLLSAAKPTNTPVADVSRLHSPGRQALTIVGPMGSDISE